MTAAAAGAEPSGACPPARSLAARPPLIPPPPCRPSLRRRLSTVRRADVIAVVQDGTVVERGSHKQLLRAGGRYASLISTSELGSYWVQSGVGDMSSSDSSSDDGDLPAEPVAAAAGA